MIKPTIPASESARISALQSYKILDSAPESDFDDIVQLASHICNTPIALISFVDEDRQWFKSRKGITVSETSRSVSFCAHAINEPDEVLEVPDTLKDERFNDNPLVMGEDQIRFYTGVPLVNDDGMALGTLCVLDREPRTLTADQRLALRTLSNQVMAQLALRKSLHRTHDRSAHFEFILEAAGDAIYELGPDGRFTYVNEFMESLCKRQRSDLTQTHFLELIDQLDQQRVKDHYDQALADRCEQSQIEFRLNKDAGNEVWVAQNAQLFYKENKFVRGIGVVRDITHKKQLERDLKLTQLSVNLSPAGFSLIQEDARVVLFNSQYAELLGVSEENVDKQYVYEFDSNYDKAAWKAHWQEMLVKKEMELETQFQHVDGRFRDVELRLKMIQFEGKNFIHAICLDITKRKENEAELNHYKELLQKTNQIARIGTWEVDLQQNLPLWSKITREIHEMPSDYQPDLTSAIDFYKEGETRNRITKLFGNAVEQGIHFDEELEIISGKGNEKWVRTIGIPVMEGNACIRIHGIFQDITIQKANERKIAERGRQLKLANEELERFAYMVTHDLKLPLSNIQGHIEIIKMESDPDSDILQQSIGWIEASLTQANEKIQAVLEFARQDNELASSSGLHEVNLRSTLDKVIESVDSKLQAVKGSIKMDLSNDLVVYANSSSLESIFENLLNNAIKYSRPGVPPRIRISAEKTASKIRAKVADNGIGIDLKKDGDLIFSMFGRLSTDLDVHGTGVGLYLSKKNIETLGGSLTVESIPGKGSSFILEFPLSKAQLNSNKNVSVKSKP